MFASTPMLQSRLARGLPPGLRPNFPSCASDAQRALQFTRSAPGLVTALAGMSSPAHVREDLALAQFPPLSAGEVRALFE